MHRGVYIVPTNPSHQPVKLTKSVVDQIAPPSEGQAFYRDAQILGFGLRVTANGTKSFIVEKRINGRVRRITLGRYGTLTPEQARQCARQELGKIALGHDTVLERRQARVKATTLKNAHDDFMKARKALKASTAKDYTRIFNTVFTPWHDKPLNALTKQMMLHKHRELSETRGKAHANLCMRFLRAVLNFAKEVYDDPRGQPILPENPVRVLTTARAWNKVGRRQTYIKAPDLHAWYTAVQALRNCELTDPNLPGEGDYSMYDTVADFLELLLFTGLRRQEAITLRWQDVDLQHRTLTIRNTKNSEPLALPLSDHLLNLFAARQAGARNPYVFPGKDGNGYLIEPKRQMKKVAEASKVPFCAHDLRRTFIAVAESLDIPMYAIKRLVNHKMNNDVTAGYIISDVERLRAPMQRITNFLLSASNTDQASKVVTLRSKPTHA